MSLLTLISSKMNSNSSLVQIVFNQMIEILRIFHIDLPIFSVQFECDIYDVLVKKYLLSFVSASLEICWAWLMIYLIEWGFRRTAW